MSRVRHNVEHTEYLAMLPSASFSTNRVQSLKLDGLILVAGGLKYAMSIAHGPDKPTRIAYQCLMSCPHDYCEQNVHFGFDSTGLQN
jgi:hypothetical protein